MKWLISILLLLNVFALQALQPIARQSFQDGFTKEQLELNNLNEQIAELRVRNKGFILKSGTQLAKAQSSVGSLLVIGSVSIGMLLFFWFKFKRA